MRREREREGGRRWRWKVANGRERMKGREGLVPAGHGKLDRGLVVTPIEMVCREKERGREKKEVKRGEGERG